MATNSKNDHFQVIKEISYITMIKASIDLRYRCVNAFTLLAIAALLICCKTDDNKPGVPVSIHPTTATAPSYFTFPDIDPFISVSQMTNRDVRQLLAQMHIADQQYRDSLHNAGRKDRERFYSAKMIANDKANLKVLEKIISKFGWPGVDTFGEDAAETAWLVIWHHRSNREVLCRHFDLMQQAVSSGQMKENFFNLIQEQILTLPVEQVGY